MVQEQPPAVEQEVKITPAPQAPIVPVSTGDCKSELAKYDWPQDQAYKVMMIESTNVPTVVNNNPATGDYSVGCFQINLIGSMRATRPSEESLKIAENNVRYAYQMYVGQGRTFCKTSGWYNTCKKLGLL